VKAESDPGVAGDGGRADAAGEAADATAPEDPPPEKRENSRLPKPPSDAGGPASAVTPSSPWGPARTCSVRCIGG
jgi:hypothetical protein